MPTDDDEKRGVERSATRRSSPPFALPPHVVAAALLRAAVGPSVQDGVGETKVAIDDVAMFWAAE